MFSNSPGLKLPEGRPISLQALFRLGIYPGKHCWLLVSTDLICLHSFDSKVHPIVAKSQCHTTYLLDEATIGGKAEADAAYDEAMEAVFCMQVDQHCHVQCRVTPSGERRWNLIELWSLEVVLAAALLFLLLLT